MSVDKHIKILKYILYILLIVSMSFGLIDKCHAMNTIVTGTDGAQEYQPPQGSGTWSITGWNGSFKNVSGGYALMEFQIRGKIEIYEFTIRAKNISYPCNIGSTQYYNDSSSQIVNMTIICPVDFDGNGVQNVQVTLYSQLGDAKIRKYNRMSYVYDTNYTDLLNQIKTAIANNGTGNVVNAINNQSTQQHQDAVNTQNKLNDINNTMNNSSIDSPSSSTSSWSNMNASNGTITNLLTLPIQLMQGYVNGMNSSCTPFNLGNLMGNNITLPCINIGNLIGSTLWGIIDVLFSGFMIFGIAKKLIKIFNDFTNMKSNQVDELYGGGA